jgi:hypothetical protein
LICDGRGFVEEEERKLWWKRVVKQRTCNLRAWGNIRKVIAIAVINHYYSLHSSLFVVWEKKCQIKKVYFCTLFFYYTLFFNILYSNFNPQKNSYFFSHTLYEEV